ATRSRRPGLRLPVPGCAADDRPEGGQRLGVLDHRGGNTCRRPPRRTRGIGVPRPDRAWYEELRATYRPRVVRLLLIGESPPDPGDGARRFFYAPTLSHDNLYRGVAAAFYGTELGFDPSEKLAVLDRLRADGVWLIDAVDEPIDKPVQRDPAT